MASEKLKYDSEHFRLSSNLQYHLDMELCLWKVYLNRDFVTPLEHSVEGIPKRLSLYQTRFVSMNCHLRSIPII